MSYDFNIPGPVVFAFTLYAGALTAAACSVMGSIAYVIVVRWGKPK